VTLTDPDTDPGPELDSTPQYDRDRIVVNMGMDKRERVSPVVAA